jgi:hypothetical protein
MYTANNVSQTGSGNWVALAASFPTSTTVQDNTGWHHYFSAAGVCPTTGTNTFATCFGTTPQFNIATNGVVTYGGLTSMPVSGTVTANHAAGFDGAGHIIDLGAQIPAIPVRAGTVTITNPATTAAVTFATAMTATPTTCQLTPSASAAVSGIPFSTALATTGFTANVPVTPTASLVIQYACFVNNAN